MKTKTGKEVAQAFRKLFLSVHPSRLWTDKGTEFYNQQLKAVLTANNVTLYSTENKEKSSIVEQWNRTMKNIMQKYFTANNTQNYKDVIPSLVEKYNITYNRTIKLTPSDARNPTNYQHVHNALYAKVNAPNWTEEVFTISSVKATKPPTYTIKGTLGEPVQGTFYEQELQLSAQERFHIGRVLKKKKNQVFVKWNGYSDAFNLRVPLTDLEA